MSFAQIAKHFIAYYVFTYEYMPFRMGRLKTIGRSHNKKASRCAGKQLLSKTKSKQLTPFIFKQRQITKQWRGYNIRNCYRRYWKWTVRNWQQVFWGNSIWHMCNFKLFRWWSNHYYSSTGHHEQKNKKTTGQIKFSAVTIKQNKTSLTIFFYCCCSVSSTVFPV